MDQKWLLLMLMLMPTSAGPVSIPSWPYPDARPSRMLAEATFLPSGRRHTPSSFPPGFPGLIARRWGWDVYWILGVSSAGTGRWRPHEPLSDLSYSIWKLWSIYPAWRAFALICPISNPPGWVGTWNKIIREGSYLNYIVFALHTDILFIPIHSYRTAHIHTHTPTQRETHTHKHKHICIYFLYYRK